MYNKINQNQIQEWLLNPVTELFVKSVKQHKSEYEQIMLAKIMSTKPLSEENDGIQILKGQIYELDALEDLESYILETQIEVLENNENLQSS